MRATQNAEPHNHPHTACCGPLFLARCSWLTMVCRTTIVLALALVTGCFTGPSDNAGFGSIQDLAQLDGVYRNLGDSGNSQARVLLSEIIWPEDTSLPHKSIDAIEVREIAAGTLIVNASIDLWGREVSSRRIPSSKASTSHSSLDGFA